MPTELKLKPEETKGRAYVDRMLLDQLSDLETVVKLGEIAQRLGEKGIGLGAVKALLASNPDRFAYHERRWMPAARLESLGRPLAEAVKLIVSKYGAPLATSAVVSELVRIRSKSVDVENAARRLALRDPGFIVLPDDRLCLAEWAFLGTDLTVERAFALNGVTEADVAAVKKKLGDFDWRQPNAVENAVKLCAPVSVKALGAAAWLDLNPQDPRSILVFDDREFFGKALSVPGYVFVEGDLMPEKDAPKWIAAAMRVAEKLAPQIEVEDAAPIDVKDEDVERMVSLIKGAEKTVTGTRLLEDFYEITSANRTFPDDLGNLMDALTTRSDIWWVGGDRFRKPNSAPDFVFSVPEVFQFSMSGVLDEEGEPVDIELDDDGLSSSLRKLLIHPLATDVLDEDILPQPKTMPPQIRLVLKSLHRELGTFPMCQVPTGWLDGKPSVQELMLVDVNGRELQAWANHEARLLFGFIDWWYEQPTESGAVFTLTKTGRPNVLEFEWLDQPDPVLYMTSQRMEELRELQANSEGKSTLQLLIEVMGHWPKGADFFAILAHLNVVRRSSRRMVASLLSSYQCFHQRSGSPLWHFDPKKVELGFDKTKKRFVRK